MAQHTLSLRPTKTKLLLSVISKALLRPERDILASPFVTVTPSIYTVYRHNLQKWQRLFCIAQTFYHIAYSHFYISPMPHKLYLPHSHPLGYISCIIMSLWPPKIKFGNGFRGFNKHHQVSWTNMWMWNEISGRRSGYTKTNLGFSHFKGNITLSLFFPSDQLKLS